MADTNLADIAEKLQNLDKRMSALQSCYTVLHKDLMCKKIDPSSIFTEIMRKRYEEMNKEINRFISTAKEVREHNESCFKWIAHELNKIHEKMKDLEKRDQQRFQVQVSLVDKDQPEICKGDITPTKMLNKFMHSLPERTNEIIGATYPSNNEIKSIKEVAKELSISVPTAKKHIEKALRLARVMHRKGEIRVEYFPQGKLRDAILEGL